VVDKDYATAVLAVGLEAERMILVTDVDSVYREYGSPAAAPIPRMDTDEAARMAATLPPGSMGSKLESAVDFVRRRGGAAEVIITRPEDLLLAAAGRAGTRITGSSA
jgi:carbamate kinase